jgi:hypothetical protein
MFLSFLFRGLSLPAHEFLRGLLFVFGVQLHQLTPNSILHIACFITLCESFLGIEPHFLFWRSIFRLYPSVALSNKPKLGRDVVSVCAEAQYLNFCMSASVQGWRTKWFYIKDHKASSEDEYGLAPFDDSKELKKLVLAHKTAAQHQDNRRAFVTTNGCFPSKATKDSLAFVEDGRLLFSAKRQRLNQTLGLLGHGGEER